MMLSRSCIFGGTGKNLGFFTRMVLEATFNLVDRWRDSSTWFDTGWLKARSLFGIKKIWRSFYPLICLFKDIRNIWKMNKYYLIVLHQIVFISNFLLFFHELYDALYSILLSIILYILLYIPCFFNLISGYWFFQYVKVEIQIFENNLQSIPGLIYVIIRVISEIKPQLCQNAIEKFQRKSGSL